MKIIFFGTPHVAESVLNQLIDQNIEILAVVTRPDKPQGRSKKHRPTCVKACAQNRLPNIPILQPTKASTPEFAETLKSFNADLFVVVAYGEIIKQFLLDIPPQGCINVHFSLLPKWRGAAPMQHTLLNGDTETGVTIIEMALAMDAGDIIATKSCSIPPDMTCGELADTLCALSGPLLADTIQQIQSLPHTPQDHSLATLAPKISPEMAPIDWSQSAEQIHNQIRALSPAPGAWTSVNINGQTKRLKILRSSLSNSPWAITCGTGTLYPLEVQLEGKKPTQIKNFIAGYPQVSLA